jgi:hypothetical protein
MVQDEHVIKCGQPGRCPWTDGESCFAVVQALEAAAGSL